MRNGADSDYLMQSDLFYSCYIYNWRLKSNSPMVQDKKDYAVLVDSAWGWTPRESPLAGGS